MHRAGIFHKSLQCKINQNKRLSAQVHIVGTGLFGKEGPKEEKEVGAQTSVPDEKRNRDGALGLTCSGVPAEAWAPPKCVNPLEAVG